MKEEIKAITIASDEKYLRQKSKYVDVKTDKKLNQNIETLEQYCLNHKVMAMAAVQIGIPKRIIYLKNTNLDIINKINSNNISEKEELEYNEAKVLINPRIINKEGITEYWEACASCLDNCGRVLRPYKIVLEYEDIESNKHRETYKGFESTVLSHEIDHLDGILHIDISLEIKKMNPEERKIWRQTHDYKVIKKNGDYEEQKRSYIN